MTKSIPVEVRHHWKPGALGWTGALLAWILGSIILGTCGCVDDAPAECGPPPEVQWQSTADTVSMSVDDFATWSTWTSCMESKRGR